MQRIVYIIILIIISVFARAEERPEAKKTFSKTFSVGSNATAEVQTNFGKVEYKIGKSGEVSYSVEVIVDGNNEKMVQSKLESISIDFSKRGNTVRGATIMPQTHTKNINVKINYVIYIPGDANVLVDANYVDVYLPKITANAKLSCNYTDVYISGELNNFEMISNYSDIRANSPIGNIELSGNYNDYKFDKISHIEFQGNYSDIDINYLGSKAKFRSNYSDFKILGMASQNVSILINGNYLDGIFYCNNDMYISASGNYMDVKHDSRYLIKKYIAQGSSREIVARTSTNTNSILEISGNYSDINLK